MSDLIPSLYSSGTLPIPSTRTLILTDDSDSLPANVIIEVNLDLAREPVDEDTNSLGPMSVVSDIRIDFPITDAIIAGKIFSVSKVTNLSVRDVCTQFGDF